MNDALFTQAPWRTQVGDVAGRPPGMLGDQEAALLYHLARDYCRGWGEIIDGGAFLGASSYVLARGLEANARIGRKAGRVHAYDLFQVWTEPGGDGTDQTSQWLRDVFGVETAGDESTLPIYTANLGALARHVRVRAGDILQERWSGRPIELLFIDICKTRPIWRHVARTFLPSLIPGASVVVHQDWHHPWLPYLHVGQEALADYFEVVVRKADDSAAFRLADRIPDRVLAQVADHDFSPADELRLIDRAIARFAGENRFLRLAKAELLRQHGRLDEASRQVHETYTGHGEAMTDGEQQYFSVFAGGLAVRIEGDIDAARLHGGFDERAYLDAHADVTYAVGQGFYASGRQHWIRHGRWEGRALRRDG